MKHDVSSTTYAPYTASVNSPETPRDTRVSDASYSRSDAPYQSRELADPIDRLTGHNPDTNESARIFTDPFEDYDIEGDDGQPLYKTMLGRAETKFVTRAIFAAATYTAASYMLKEWKIGVHGDDQTFLGKPLQMLADAFDKPVEIMHDIIERIGGDTEAFDHFMTFNKYKANPYMVEQAIDAVKSGADTVIENHQVFGMTFGQELVDRTFSFAAGSVGASLGREVVNALDPHVEKSWITDGKIDGRELINAITKKTWQIFSRNQMEDWFAGIPYVFSLRAGRGLMDGGLPGTDAAANAAMWDFHNGANGNSHTVTPEGMIGHSFEGTGIADFQSRFMSYNFYTLLFRDLYNAIAHAMQECKENGLSLPSMSRDNHADESERSLLGEIGKYPFKTLIKSQIYMLPAVGVFWPQFIGLARDKGMLVDQETGNLVTTQPTLEFDPSDKFHRHRPFAEMVDGEIMTSPHSDIP